MNASTTAEEMLRLNTAEYQQHQSTKNRLSKALKFQENIQTFQTIPKRFYPSTTPEIICPSKELAEKFEAEYRKLFSRHLEEVITHNTISLELENARLKEIVQRTEKQLSTIQAPPETINELRQQFYTKNNIKNELSSPNAHKSDTVEDATNKKRKQSPQPDPRRPKKSRRHFLSKCPSHRPLS